MTQRHRVTYPWKLHSKPTCTAKQKHCNVIFHYCRGGAVSRGAMSCAETRALFRLALGKASPQKVRKKAQLPSGTSQQTHTCLAFRLALFTKGVISMAVAQYVRSKASCSVSKSGSAGASVRGTRVCLWTAPKQAIRRGGLPIPKFPRAARRPVPGRSDAPQTTSSPTHGSPPHGRVTGCVATPYGGFGRGLPSRVVPKGRGLRTSALEKSTRDGDAPVDDRGLEGCLSGSQLSTARGGRC